ncbi:hypothetical protein C3489_01985 [Streptomyces sp. Ru71]|uniref:protein phosphatase 2C domain-containing protein n=1 Tax=Streptomyces sp. Ru71 TaxID=2080746 RepID=UPI000CDDF14C|nr:protein phosphatase 2C domain-containing protein [Streptomyces sp. Ru71]POX57042.1 hypothetical protein C3489_01985 [Streptomyces sp. Ru71]
MDKRVRFPWHKDRADERQDAPEAATDDGPDGTRPAPAQAGPPGAGHPARPYPPPDYPVPDYQVPDYRVSDYQVPEYSGPDLNAPDRPRPPGSTDRAGGAYAEQPAPGDHPAYGTPPLLDGRPPQGYGVPPQGYGTAPPPDGQWSQGYGTAPPADGQRSQGYGTAPPDGQRSQGYGTPPPPPAQPPRGHGAVSGPGQPESAGRGSRVPRPEGDPWQRIVLGTPAVSLEAKPPPADPYRPDTLFDGWSTPHLTVRLASVRGDAHRVGGLPRQDDVVVAWHEPTGTVAFAVADGVSAAPQSHVGAALACRTAVNDLLVQLGEDRAGPDWSRVVHAAAYQLHMRVARGREPDERDRAEAVRTLATTLVAGTVAPAEDGGMHVTVVRAGDSSAWLLQAGRFMPLLHDGTEDSDDISSTAVVALPRLAGQVRPLSYTLPADCVLLVGTDGFGVPLGDGTGLVGQMFAQGLTVPPVQPWTLARLLDFSRETFDDDRTLLAVWPRHRLPTGPGPSGGSR